MFILTKISPKWYFNKQKVDGIDFLPIYYYYIHIKHVIALQLGLFRLSSHAKASLCGGC